MYPGDNAIAISASLAIYLIAFVNSVVSIGGHSSDYIASLLFSETSRTIFMSTALIRDLSVFKIHSF